MNMINFNFVEYFITKYIKMRASRITGDLPCFFTLNKNKKPKILEKKPLSNMHEHVNAQQQT